MRDVGLERGCVPLPVRLGDHRTFVDLPATSSTFQLAPATVADDHVLLVLGKRVTSPDEQRTILELLRRRSPASSVAFVLDDSTGRVNMETSSTTSPSVFAAAAAVVRASWSWDESEHFVVTVNSTDYRVGAYFDGDAWQAVVQRPVA